MADEHVTDPASDAPEATDARGAAGEPSAGLEALTRERDDLYDRLLRKTAELITTQLRSKTNTSGWATTHAN